MNQEKQIEFVRAVTDQAAREVIEEIKSKRIPGRVTQRRLRDWVIAACIKHQRHDESQDGSAPKDSQQP